MRELEDHEGLEKSHVILTLKLNRKVSEEKEGQIETTLNYSEIARKVDEVYKELVELNLDQKSTSSNKTKQAFVVNEKGEMISISEYLLNKRDEFG